VLRLTDMPAILLECGVILNRAEEQKLTLPQTRENLAKTIIDALRLFQRLVVKPEEKKRLPE